MLLLPAFLLLNGCKKEEYRFEDLPETVKSFFTTEKTVFEMEEEIQFTNESLNAATYFWDFGDGTGSQEQNPVKSYAESGNYTVKLRAIGPGGTGNYSTVITVAEKDAGSDRVLYYIEYGSKEIRQISLEPGAVAETVANISGKAGVGLAYDSVNAKIYFSDFTNTDDGKIWRMNLDGTNAETLVAGITDPYSVAVNLKGNKIYWADDAGNISRANLDGTGLERTFIHIENGQMRAIAYDAKNDRIYFYEVNEENLYSANADGSSVEKIVEGAYGYAIFVDEVNGKLYFEDRNVPAIMQSSLSGSGVVKIADVPRTRVHGMAIDFDASKLYWANRDGGTIGRANLDGTDAEVFLTGLKSPRGLFIK